MKSFFILNNQKQFFNLQFVNKLILCSFFVNVSCNDRILYSTLSTSPSENSSTPYADVSQLLELCFADHLNPTIISPELIDGLDLKSSEVNKTSTMTIGPNFKANKHTVFVHNSYPTYFLAGNTTEKIKSLLKGLKSSPLWSIKSKFFIIGIHGKSCLRYALEFLKFLWRNDFLSSFYLCPMSRNFTMIYTYNPFTNYAPHPWKEIEATEKPNSRWTLYYLRFTNEKEACHNIEFDKTKLLNGYTIKICTHSSGLFFRKKVIFSSLNLTTDRYYNSKFFDKKYSLSIIKNGSCDMNLYFSSLKHVHASKIHEIPVYFELSFLIATQYRNNPQPPQIDSVIDSYTGMIMIISLLSLITVIALINKYQFGAAFRDVYLLLLGMEVLLPLNRCFSRVVYLSAFLFAFVFSPLLEGQFFALLAKPTYRNVENLEDLYENKYQVRFLPNIYKDILDTGLWTTDEDIKYLHKNKQGNSHDCLKLARKQSSTACIDGAEFMLIYAHKFKLHISKETLFPSFYVHYTRRNWPLRDRVGKKMLHAFEAGFNNDMNNRKFISDQLKKMKAIERAAEFENYDLVDATDLIPLYMFTALIFIVAVAIFFLENIISRLRLSRLLMPENFELQDRTRIIDENVIIIDEEM